DPNSSIPVYAPRGGCATFTDPEDDPGTPGNENRPPSVIIRVTRSGSQTECNTPAQNDDLFIVLTHIIRDSSIPIAPGNPLPITAGHRVGYMCLSAEAVNP